MMRLPVPLYEQQEFAVDFHRGSIDENTVSIVLYEEQENQIETGTATSKEEGQFVYTVGPFSDKKIYDLVWTDSSGISQTTYFEVVDQMPTFSQLTDAEKAVVVSVYDRVSDSFDSIEGGPYLFELRQNRHRHVFEVIAERMVNGLDIINFEFPPPLRPPYEVGWSAQKRFPEGWHGLLARVTYVEFLRHLSRSYIEQPDVQGMNVGRLDRQRYRNEWRTEYDDERDSVDSMIRMFKRQFVGRSDRALLLGGMNVPHGMPTRPQFRMLRYI